MNRKENEDTIKTPVLDEMLKIRNQTVLCSEFLDWLLARYDLFDPRQARETSCYIGRGDYINKENVLADFFGIDLQEAEKERQILFDQIKKVDQNKELHHCKLCGANIEEEHLKICNKCAGEFQF